MAEPAPTGAPPRALIIVAVLLAVTLAAAVAVFGLSQPDSPADGPLPLVSVEAPEAGSGACASLLDALPDELPSHGRALPRRALADPAPPGAAAWGTGDPVVLRCGLREPSELTRSSALREINGVRWLPVTGQRAATWYVVDRDAFIALSFPEGVGTGPLQRISEVVAEAIPMRP